MRRGFVAVDLTSDASAVATPQLQAAIGLLPRSDLQIFDDQLCELETSLHSASRLDHRDATVETEAAFVDRPISGEAVLTAPDEENMLISAASLNRQILAAPSRRGHDLHEHLCTMVESRLEQRPRTARIRNRLVEHVASLTVRRRALRRLRERRSADAAVG